MKEFIVFVMLTGLLVSLSQETFAQDFKKISGEWTFSVPNASYGYTDGTITFTKKDAEIKGEVKFESGYKVDLKDIAFKENELTFSLYIDYELIEVAMTLKDGKLSGKVSTSGGKLDISAER